MGGKGKLYRSIKKMLCLLIFSLLLFEAQAQAPVVDLGYVKYKGFQNVTAGINYYRGIPFSQATIGSLRWRAPII
jgi:hypothetical protein